MSNLEPSTNDFIQVTRGYVGDLRRLARRAPAARQVFDLICEKMNRSNALVISQTTMASILGYSRQTISSAVALLERESWLQTIKIGTANAYVLNSKVVWRDVGGKRYSAFNARVYVSEEEQSKTVEQWDAVKLKHVPVLLPGEMPISDDEDLPPPDQKDLLPLDSRELPKHNSDPWAMQRAHYAKQDAMGVPRVLPSPKTTKTDAELSIDELEAIGQQRLVE